MTFTTKRNYIEPVFRCIAGMMILFCLFAARTLQSIGVRQFAHSYSIIHRILSFCFFGVSFPVILLAISICGFAFIGFLIFLSSCFELLGLSIKLPLMIFTNFATTSMSIWSGTILGKFRKCFNFFAIGTGFCLNWFRHLLFLNKSLCLEPTMAHTTVGLLIILQAEEPSNRKLKSF